MRTVKNLKVRTKINMLIAIFVAALLVVGIVGQSSMSKMNQNSDMMYKDNLLPIQFLSAIRTNTQKTLGNLFEIMITKDPARNTTLLNSIQNNVKDNDRLIGEYENTLLDAYEKERLAKFKEVNKLNRAARQELLDLAAKNMNDEAYAVYLRSIAPLTDQIAGLLEELITYNTKVAADNRQSINSSYQQARNTTIGLVVIALLICAAVGYFISRTITAPLKQVVDLVAKVADGDLRETTELDTKDELGQLAKSINAMVLSLRGTMQGILGSAESVAAAAQQISASSEEIAGGSASQAQASQNMMELFRELTTAINSVAISAEHATELSNQTTQIAQAGGKVLRSSIEGMQSINEQMSHLEEDSVKIGEIIDVIDNIAEQTNLLALNAAIEAARAGDQGRGFAVVADEVRKLAERSSDATKQITSIIKGMQHKTKQSVTAVSEGAASSKQTGEAFERIIAMVNESAVKVTEIAAASEEQAAQSEEVLLSVESISAATEESAASSQETASTAQTLAHLSEDLNRSVSRFKVS